jgi:hypothetical protein
VDGGGWVGVCVCGEGRGKGGVKSVVSEREASICLLSLTQHIFKSVLIFRYKIV